MNLKEPLPDTNNADITLSNAKQEIRVLLKATTPTNPSFLRSRITVESSAFGRNGSSMSQSENSN
jgi:hypothetical protein